MAVLEILTFTASEAFQKDPQLNRDLFEYIRNSKGLQHIYVATGIEEPNTRWFILVWDSYEDHKALMDDKDYSKVIEKLKPLLGGEPNMAHVAFNNDTRAALTHPVTQIATGELKDKQDPEKKEAFKSTMIKTINEWNLFPSASERAPFCVGEVREHPGSFYFLGGWKSIEHYKQIVESDRGNVKGLEQLKQSTTYKVNYAHVKEYELRRG